MRPRKSRKAYDQSLTCEMPKFLGNQKHAQAGENSAKKISEISIRRLKKSLKA
jgi:hypothetical protein